MGAVGKYRAVGAALGRIDREGIKSRALSYVVEKERKLGEIKLSQIDSRTGFIAESLELANTLEARRQTNIEFEEDYESLKKRAEVEGLELRSWKHKFLKRLDQYFELKNDSKEKAEVNTADLLKEFEKGKIES